MSGYRSCVLSPDEYPEWDTLSAQAGHGRIFTDRRWLLIISECFGVQVRMAAVEADGAPVAGLPMMTRKRGMFCLSTPPPVSLYNSLILDHSHPMQDAAAVLHLLLKTAEKSCNYISTVISPMPAAEKTFAGHGWRLSDMESIILEIGDYQETWKNFSQSLRRKIRRAEEQNLRFHELDDAGIIISLHQKSYARHHLAPPIPNEVLGAWLKRLHDAGLARFYAAALPLGDIVSARVVVPDGRILFDLVAGADIAAHDIAASHWLVAKILQLYSANEFLHFDFMGANTPGVSDFKRSFGGRYVSYRHAVYYSSTLIRSLVTIRRSATLRRRRLK